MEISRVLDLVQRLERAGIHARLCHRRSDGISIEVAVPGERWEIDLLADGEIAVEGFRSDGRVEGVRALDRLFDEFAEPEI